MSDETRFSFLISAEERTALQQLARADYRSQAAMIRHLIYKAACERGLLSPRQGHDKRALGDQPTPTSAP